MSTTDTTLAVPDADSPRENRWLEEWGDIVIPVFLLGMLIPVRGVEFLIPALTLPVNTLACAALVGIGVWAGARWKAGSVLVSLAGTGLVLWLVGWTLWMHGLDELRRSLNIITLFAVAAVLGAGRLHVRSVTRGVVIGMIIALAFSAALIPGSSYEGRLTGVLGDPNAAGYVLTTLGFAVIQSLRTRRARLAFWAVVGIGVLLTVSRTTLFAYAVATLWVWFAPRINRLLSVATLGVSAALYAWMDALAEERGWFTERSGSDDLRAALALAEQQMVRDAGWLGQGLGTAEVQIRGTTLFFHNSYRAMQTEGGLIAMGLLIALIVGVFLMFHQLPAKDRPVWAEGALICGLICSFNIGFSLTSPPIAVALGLYLAYHGAARERIAAEADGGQ
ncbi:hypothetical protein H5399_12850 [Tessaracoccus sp. MC1627]|uniref:O-antigen ligase family protein n=1 Tax=Tessaracoccus sp. MC1627 TaxID=2760312 RepID=UPI001603DF28|nr:hypothetical protein [Tessaracoccus sp. MC1627]MBB1513184.1 hypothetical protein [Tessaracoccus sp. MC1627]MBB1513483.1 hypothetical protein [Tessaracoccus sp. MC1627]